MSDGVTCETCRFFRAEVLMQRMGSVDVGEPIKGHGYCRRHPPLADNRGVGRFPIIRGAEWCGHHEGGT